MGSLPIVLVCCSAACAVGEAARLDLVKDGKPVSTIVIPEKADTWTVEAARWLQEYIYKATGAELKIVPETRKALPGTLIAVGHTKMAEETGIDISDLKYDGCKLIAERNVLYLLGRDDTIEIPGKPRLGAKGTCRAVVTFLEEVCGVRWFLPGPMGERVPRTKDISIPHDLNRKFIPAFVSSSGRYPYGSKGQWLEDITPAAIANNFRVAIKGSYGGQTYYRMLPSGVGQYSQSGNYFATNPEYFALIDGERTGEGNHLCSSNPEVKKILLEAVRREFEKGYDMVAFGQEDGYLRCQCPECEKLDNYRGWGPSATDRQLGLDEGEEGAWNAFYDRLRENPCERVHLLHKYVVDECRKSHPDKMINILLYGPTMYPSKEFESYGDNVVGEICTADPRVPDAWKGKVAWLTGYFYWFNSTLPMGVDVHASPREIAEGIRTLHEKGFRGISQYAETNWGLQGPLFYEFGRLLGDPERDYEALIEEYCRGVYGRAADTMLAFFDLLYRRHERYSLNPGHYGKIPPRGEDGKWLSMSEIYLDLYTAQLLQELEALLSQAEREAETDRSRGWLRLTRDHFDFAKLLTEAIRSYRTWQADRSAENGLDLKARVEAFDAYRTRIITYPRTYTDLWFPGHDKFCNYLTSDAQSEHEVYYSNWESRKEAVLRQGVKGTGIGYEAGGSIRYVREPLTLDFSKQQLTR